MVRNAVIAAVAFGAALANAHIGAWHKAMFCLNGLSNEEDLQSSEVGHPLHNLTFDEFWLHGKCKDYPPAEGEFLELPVGGKAKLELASNRGLTTLSFDGKHAHTFPAIDEHPEYDNGSWDNTCIKEPNMHTENRTRASGTALGIAYKSNIYEVMPEDVVIFSILEHSPWHREAEYEVPADLPKCPDGGCICVWSWIPNGCGEANMYNNAIRCQVTGARDDAPKLAKPVTAKWCEGKPEECVKGAKRITITDQKDDVNTIDVHTLVQADGQWASPGYNEKMGFYSGAQNDIFETSGEPETTATSTESHEPEVTPTSTESDEPEVTPTSTESDEPEATSTENSEPEQTPTSTETTEPEVTATSTENNEPEATPTSTIVVPPYPTKCNSTRNASRYRRHQRRRQSPYKGF